MFHSKQWHYSLHTDFQKLHSTQRSPRDYSNSTFYIRVPIQNSKSRTPEDRELFNPEIQFYMQKAKRSSSTSIHPARPSKGIPDILDIPDIPVICDIQTLQSILHVPVPPGILPHYSILQLECIFYTSAGFHRNSTEYQLRHYKHSTSFHSSKKGRCCNISQNT